MRGSVSLALAGAAAALQAPLQSRPAVAAYSHLPTVETQALQDSIDIDKLLRRAEKLYEIAKLSEPEYNRPTRVIGSKGHEGTLDYIRSVLADLDDYYNVTEQDFPAVTGTVRESRLVVDGAVAPATAFSLSPPTARREPVDAQLVLAAGHGCAAADYPANATGNIVVVRRGTCSFGDKSALAGRAGAAAAVVVNSDDAELHGTLGDASDDHVATFGLSRAAAAPYMAALEAGRALDATAYMDATVSTIETTNIVAQTAHGDADNCVVVGGHSDGVAEGPGINDDGSGSLSLLEVAVQLTRFRVNNCVRIAWWAAEEEGLLGSNFYVASLSPAERLRIRVFGDYDMMASPNFAYQVYNATDDSSPAGSQALRDLYVAWYAAHGLNHTLVPFDGRSDYDGFIRAGIPAGGIATGAEGIKTPAEQAMFGGRAGEPYDANYHQIGDDLANLDHTAWAVNTRLIAHSVATYAASFDGFPARTPPPAMAAAAAAKPFMYRGHALIM